MGAEGAGAKFKVGDSVHFHPIIGGANDGSVYEIRAFGKVGDRIVAWLTGKSASVSLEALSPAPAKNQLLINILRGGDGSWGFAVPEAKFLKGGYESAAVAAFHAGVRCGAEFARNGCRPIDLQIVEEK